MQLIPFFNLIFSLGVFIGQFFVFAVLLFFLFPGEVKARAPFVQTFFSAIRRHSLWLAFLVALIATGGSLFYSNVAGFNPCELCWFQRIFMYPLVLLLGIAIWKKDRSIVRYALPMAIVGGIISVYHNYVYYSNGGLSALCQLMGVGVSCTKRYVFEFGYVTIPVMALVAFALVIAFLSLATIKIEKK